MTAMTSAVERTLAKSGECELRFAYLTGGPASTYTPTNATGATIKVVSCYDGDTAYDSVTASVSSGVITVDAAGGTTTIYHLTYVLYR
jgi:hypothetical protein